MAQRKIGNGIHAHGCLSCHHRFEDACDDKMGDPVCTACRTGYLAWPEMRENRLPKDCCRTHSRLVTKEEAKHYSLGSTCLWFICRACARTHPFRNPATERIDA